MRPSSKIAFCYCDLRKLIPHLLFRDDLDNSEVLEPLLVVERTESLPVTECCRRRSWA